MSVPLALLLSVLSEGLEQACWDMRGREGTGKESNDTERKKKKKRSMKMENKLPWSKR